MFCSFVCGEQVRSLLFAVFALELRVESIPFLQELARVCQRFEVFILERSVVLERSRECLFVNVVRLAVYDTTECSEGVRFRELNAYIIGIASTGPRVAINFGAEGFTIGAG